MSHEDFFDKTSRFLAKREGIDKVRLVAFASPLQAV